MAWIATGIAVASAATTAYSSYKQYSQQSKMHKYNAQVAENEALAQQYAIEAERQKLTDAQRGLKAKQRMSVASRGGLMAGTDLSTLAEEAKEMQLDQLELTRQKDLAAIRGKSQAAMERYKGKAAKSAGRWTVATALSGGGSTYASLGGKTYLGEKPGKG